MWQHEILHGDKAHNCFHYNGFQTNDDESQIMNVTNQSEVLSKMRTENINMTKKSINNLSAERKDIVGAKP